MIENIAIGVVSAIVYSAVFYIKKHQIGQTFDANKMAATLVVGGLVGLLYSLTGQQITEQGIATQLLTYTGTIALFESIIKAVIRLGARR